VNDELRRDEEPATSAPDVLQWQIRLLPFVLRVLVVLAGFFLVATLGQLVVLQLWVSRAPDVRSTIEKISPALESQPERWMAHARVMLEAAIFDRRYHQANAYLMARIWTRYLGFLTGMVLAIIGAVFVLAKLRSESKLEAGWAGVRAEVVTASPGIALATLGAVLMLATIVVHHPIDLTDNPMYLQREGTVPALPTDDRPPVLIRPSATSNAPEPQGS
jgi:hypothetical protein